MAPYIRKQESSFKKGFVKQQTVPSMHRERMKRLEKFSIVIESKSSAGLDLCRED